MAQSSSNTRFVCRIFNFHLPAVKTRPAFIETSLFAHRSLALMLGRTKLKHHHNKVHLDPRLNFRKISANSFVLFTIEGIHFMRLAANQRYAYIGFIFSKISGKPHESKLEKNKGWVFNLYRSIAASWHTTFSKWVKREIFHRCQMMSVNI